MKTEYFNGWFDILHNINFEEVAQRMLVLEKTTTLTPRPEDWFRAFHLCPYNKLKVVFVGSPVAKTSTGLLFGCNKGEESPFLKILKECCIDYSVPNNGAIFDETLESWAKQGILLLEYPLVYDCVSLRGIQDYKKYWDSFTGKLLNLLSEINNGIIYVFWDDGIKFSNCVNKVTNTIFAEPNTMGYISSPFPYPKLDVLDKVSSIVKMLYGEKIKWFETI